MSYLGGCPGINIQGEMSIYQRKKCMSLFGHYWTVAEYLSSSGLDEPARQRRKYIAVINSSIFDATAESSRIVNLCAEFADLKPLFERLFCCQPAQRQLNKFSRGVD